MVFRVYVEKKSGLDIEAQTLTSDLKNLLGIEKLEQVRILNRYDADKISEDLFPYAVKTVFSETRVSCRIDFDAAAPLFCAVSVLLLSGNPPVLP